MNTKLATYLCVVLTVLASSLARAQDIDRLQVGLQPDGRIVVPTNQILSPAGKQVLFPGRPVDLTWLDDGRMVVVKNMKSLVFMDVERAEIVQTLASPVGFSVVGIVTHKGRIYASDVKSHLQVAERKDDGQYQWTKSIELNSPEDGKGAHPAGIAVDGEYLWVASTRGNNVQRIDPATGKVLEVVPVGVAPYMIAVIRSNGEECLAVSNWGGDHPKSDDTTAPSSGTPTRVDPKTGIANSGTVSIITQVDGKWKQRQSIPVGLHPCAMLANRDNDFRHLWVANAASDTVSFLETGTFQLVETIACRPESRLPFGSGSNALALSPDRRSLYVANGTNNCLVVLRRAPKSVTETPARLMSRTSIAGLIPTGWYPGAILVSPNGKKLIVANVKGHGSLSQPREKEKGKNSHDHLGSVSIIDVPDEKQLVRYTEQVNANNRLAYSLAGLEQPRKDIPRRPVPQRHGEPSLFEHVIYIIKENRTYDQVFGDMPEGNGDPNLVIFGEEVTPNHHALARKFTLFDNFYCSGVLSADGHQWINEAYVTDYLEKSFGGFARSYPYEGSDPLAYAPSGFLWDNAMSRGKTFRNYGEFVKTTYPKGTTWADMYQDYKNGTSRVKIEATANVAQLAPHSHPTFPGFPLTTPDVYRARLFLEELKRFEQQGKLPNLIYIFLPCDHTNGTKPGSPTPKAMVADNDLALGQIVDAVSRSKFWPKTCIFAVEDDPQNGFDHIDAHRTVALVVSPYTRRGFVDHTNYNQTGMVKTIELILGLPPMNQLDLSATPMRNCFQATADLTPYTVLPNRIPLDQMNPPLKDLKGTALKWARESLELDLEVEDRADEDTFNRILWFATRGDAPYPAHSRHHAPRDE